MSEFLGVGMKRLKWWWFFFFSWFYCIKQCHIRKTHEALARNSMRDNQEQLQYVKSARLHKSKQVTIYFVVRFTCTHARTYVQTHALLNCKGYSSSVNQHRGCVDFPPTNLTIRIWCLLFVTQRNSTWFQVFSLFN